MDFSLYLLLATVVVHCPQDRSPICLGALTTVPSNKTVYIGDTIKLECITNTSKPLEWRFTQAGTDNDDLIYNGKYVYSSGNKHKVNATGGQYHLTIANIQRSDAGTYTCIDGGSNELRSSAELTVIDSSPNCEQNSSLYQVVVENDCGIEPGSISITCLVTYHGNVAPVLEWRLNNGNKLFNGVTSRHSSYTSSIHLSLKGDSKMEGTNYECHVHGLPSLKCVTPKITTLYVRQPEYAEYQKIRKSDDSNRYVICRANTTQFCRYKWRNFLPTMGAKDLFEIPSATLRIADVDPGLYRCIAECKILDEKCDVEQMVVDVLDKH